MSENASDEQLIAIVSAGGPQGQQAFTDLYHRYREWVFTQALRFTHNHDLAHDVTQEVFIYFLRKFPGFVLTAKLTTFLYPAIRNVAIGLREKTQRFKGNDEALAAVPDEAMPEDEGNIRREMEQMMQSLSQGHREVVLLRFVDGLSMQEIAEALSLAVGTVKSRLHHALAALREDPRAMRFFEESG